MLSFGEKTWMQKPFWPITFTAMMDPVMVKCYLWSCRTFKFRRSCKQNGREQCSVSSVCVNCIQCRRWYILCFYLTTSAASVQSGPPNSTSSSWPLPPSVSLHIGHTQFCSLQLVTFLSLSRDSTYFGPCLTWLIVCRIFMRNTARLLTRWSI